eukprot:8546022-Karenia_brevis.AAC.1
MARETRLESEASAVTTQDEKPRKWHRAKPTVEEERITSNSRWITRNEGKQQEENERRAKQDEDKKKAEEEMKRKAREEKEKQEKQERERKRKERQENGELAMDVEDSAEHNKTPEETKGEERTDSAASPEKKKAKQKEVGPGGFELEDAGGNGDCGYRAVALAMGLENGKTKEE